MSQFSTNETVSLEKHIELKPHLTKIKPEDVEYVYEINRCANWILENDFKKVREVITIITNNCLLN